MPSGSSIATFAVKFLVVYGALAASWPFCGWTNAFFLRGSGKLLFEAIGVHDHVRISAAAPPEGMNDTVLSVRLSANESKALQITVSSWRISFLPTSLLIGLVVATPVGASRRVWALIVGLAIVHAFVLARLLTYVLLVDNGLMAPLVRPDTFWNEALRWFVFDFIHGHAVSCFVPVLIWITVTVRREDVRSVSIRSPTGRLSGRAC